VIAHFGEYALLAALWAWALTPALGGRALESGASTAARHRLRLAAAGAISLLYAVSDEIHQSYVSGRDADPLDVLVDAAGIATALLLSRQAQSRQTARRARVPPA
jgi:VanZ family protein